MTSFANSAIENGLKW